MIMNFELGIPRHNIQINFAKRGFYKRQKIFRLQEK